MKIASRMTLGGQSRNKYYKHLVGFEDEKWKEIILDGAQYVNAKKSKAQAQSSTSTSMNGIVDGDNDIAMSP